MNITSRISDELQLKLSQVEQTILLLNDKATVPFIARYRKEQTGDLDETHIREIRHLHKYYLELEERRQTVLESIRSQGKLTPDLEQKIRNVSVKTELEDLYLPYRPKRTTRASKAKAAGLEPFSRWLFTLSNPESNIMAEAEKYLNVEKEFDSTDKVIQGACDILAEDIASHANVRKLVRLFTREKGLFVSAVKKNHAGEKTKFEMYYDYSERIDSVPSHRLMAMLRGEKEKILTLTMEIPREDMVSDLQMRFVRHRSPARPYLLSMVEDCFDRLLFPSIETEIRKALKEDAEKEAFSVFGKNLKELLLSSPAGHRPVLGVDPGFRTGCKLTALDAIGNFLEYRAIFPNEPQNKKEEAAKILLDMVIQHGIELIAIGNGTASRETEVFVKSCLDGIESNIRPKCLVVSEAGASVYSASEAAKREFSDFDITVRGAVSIGRRLQDPLSELVKIDPKSIGVGQYQHDINQTDLKEHLEEVVEHCVNRVGVDVNIASPELLRYVSGMNKNLAEKVFQYRAKNGPFKSRSDLLQVPSFGAKTFEQAAGFLRIPGCFNPLDNSAVHPERYAFVEGMAGKLGLTVKNLIGNRSVLKSIDKSVFISDSIGLSTINDIIAELEKPGRDPRATFQYARFSDTVHTIDDLSPDMILEGYITNVTKFGAFVDIGIHQDGLVHISEMADIFVKDPLDIVKVGQVVRVKILSVEKELKRIGLSIRQAV
ncbi:MAG: RNA-binding transcriptional accessory protein [Acidobacteria bacterium]|nr:RNA-binding transcriptional accessory protein [Acidobacteriota bacterium]